VLLVEDDAAVRELARRTLTEQGYHLLVARDGLEALEVVAGRLDDVAIVVTDVIMPRLGGIPLIRRLRAQRPSLRVLLTSGYAPNADVTASDLPKLDKPYTPATLARAIRAQLDGG
jgi:CheY-like chemotaxis protein